MDIESIMAKVAEIDSVTEPSEPFDYDTYDEDEYIFKLAGIESTQMTLSEKPAEPIEEVDESIPLPSIPKESTYYEQPYSTIEKISFEASELLNTLSTDQLIQYLSSVPSWKSAIVLFLLHEKNLVDLASNFSDIDLGIAALSRTNYFDYEEIEVVKNDITQIVNSKIKVLGGIDTIISVIKVVPNDVAQKILESIDENIKPIILFNRLPGR